MPDRVTPGRVTPGRVKPGRGTLGPALRSFKRACGEFEQYWIGVTSHPVGVRLAQAGWTPQPITRICPRCGGSVGPYEADASGCPGCRALKLPWTRTVRLGLYEDALREVILDAKMTPWRRAVRDLGVLLGDRLQEELARSSFTGRDVVLAPIPTTTLRRLSRGIDQTLLLARAVRGRVPGSTIDRPMRRKHRPPQSSMPRSKRARNVSGAFLPSRRVWGRAGRSERGLVVLIDDVRTTGSTLKAASRALRRAYRLRGRGNPEIWIAVLAVAEADHARRNEAAQDLPGRSGEDELETFRSPAR